MWIRSAGHQRPGLGSRLILTARGGTLRDQAVGQTGEVAPRATRS